MVSSKLRHVISQIKMFHGYHLAKIWNHNSAEKLGTHDCYSAHSSSIFTISEILYILPCPYVIYTQNSYLPYWTQVICYENAGNVSFLSFLSLWLSFILAKKISPLLHSLPLKVTYKDRLRLVPYTLRFLLLVSSLVPPLSSLTTSSFVPLSVFFWRMSWASALKEEQQIDPD